MTVSSAGEFRVIYREPNGRAALKVLDHLDVHYRNFIALSPFMVLSTASAGPRGRFSEGRPAGVRRRSGRAHS